MRAQQILDEFKHNGINLITGVPDSVLAGLVASAKNDKDLTYVAATREEEAVGIAAGAFLGGVNTAIHMENAGLGNSINALLSLVLLYKIPMCLIISWRGQGEIDTPEHHIQGRHTQGILN